MLSERQADETASMTTDDPQSHPFLIQRSHGPGRAHTGGLHMSLKNIAPRVVVRHDQPPTETDIESVDLILETIPVTVRMSLEPEAEFVDAILIGGVDVLDLFARASVPTLTGKVRTLSDLAFDLAFEALADTGWRNT